MYLAGISNHLVIPSWFQTESILLKTGYPINVLGYDVFEVSLSFGHNGKKGMKQLKMDTKVISKLSGLSVKEIEEL